MTDPIPCFAGIDPGQTGAMAILFGGTLSLYPCPIHPSGAVDHVKMAELLHEHDYIRFAMIEDVHSMPKQGVVSTGKFMLNYGAWLQGLACAGIPTRRISPQVWKRQIGVTANKETSVRKAQALFPLYAKQFVGPRGGLNDGLSEAALLAWLAQRTWKMEGGK